MTRDKEDSPEPYRLLFPLGALAAVVGTLPWITFALGISTVYPGLSHPDMMIGGFLATFAAGFLMTAVPHFTGGMPCEWRELSTTLTLFLGLLITDLFPSRLAFHLVSAAFLAILAGYCVRRFRARSFTPPPYFVFIALGLILGISGALLLAASDAGKVTGAAFLFGKLAYTQGMLLCLIAGVGSQLLPAIWGWARPPVHFQGVNEPKRATEASRAKLGIAALAAALLAGFALEAAGFFTAGMALRAGAVVALAFLRWRIWKRPRSKGTLVFWLWISAWLLLLGLALPAVAPQYRQHLLHVMFIGGFALMTLMIASRVTLAHGGYGLEKEVRNRVLASTAVLALLATITRTTAFLAPNSYVPHLAFAAAAWILAVIAWAAGFIPKMLRRSQA